MGDPTILFIGVRNDGAIEDQVNLDSLQRTLSEKLSAAYPPIFYISKVGIKDGKQFLAVLVPGSEARPHFAGQAFVREGSRSVVASTALFEALIAERNSKVREIRKAVGTVATFEVDGGKKIYVVHILGTTRGGKLAGTIVDCNQFYVTVESIVSKGNMISFPLRQIDINFDHTEDRLELRLRD